MKDKIVKESTSLFLHKGFQGTTIKDITDAVNLTKGAIYWYFKSKDELLETILETWEKAFLNDLITANSAVEGRFLDKFRQYHKYSTEFAVSHRELCVVWTTLAAEMAGSGLKAEKKFREVLERYIEFVKDLIEMGKAEGAVKEDLDTNVLANTIIGMHNGILLQWYTKQDDMGGPELARAFRTVLLSGMGPEGP
jgi:AcrR family transcriptional regulator